MNDSKDDYLSLIWATCSKLSDEAIKLASAKAKESGFDVNRGLVPLSESFINLVSARGTLEDAIEKQKLVQLPITVQKEILGNLESISKSLLGLTNGADEIVTLTTAIEALNTSVWKYGLHNLSDQVLGYQKKVNQLKNQEVQVARILTQLDLARQRAEKIESMFEEVDKQQSAYAALFDQAKVNSSNVASLQEQTKEIETKATASFATIQQNEKQGGELLAGIRTAHSDLSALDASIRKFYSEVDDYRKKIIETTDAANQLISECKSSLDSAVEDTSSKTEELMQALKQASAAAEKSLNEKIQSEFSRNSGAIEELISKSEEQLSTSTQSANERVEAALATLASTSKASENQAKAFLDKLKQEVDEHSEETIGENATKTAALVSELANLKEQVREQIQQATGFTLFGAFQARQNQIVKSKNLWAIAIGMLVLISASVTIWIAYEAKTYNAHDFAFWIKLSLTLPLGFAITFCTVQYGRERRLEEEYAFKSSISVSLNPYRDLVHSILEKDAEVDKSKYTDFVIDSVTRVFTSPTERVFDSDQEHGLTKRTFKDAAEVIGAAVKAVK